MKTNQEIINSLVTFASNNNGYGWRQMAKRSACEIIGGEELQVMHNGTEYTLTAFKRGTQWGLLATTKNVDDLCNIQNNKYDNVIQNILEAKHNGKDVRTRVIPLATIKEMFYKYTNGKNCYTYNNVAYELPANPTKTALREIIYIIVEYKGNTYKIYYGGVSMKGNKFCIHIKKVDNKVATKVDNKVVTKVDNKVTTNDITDIEKQIMNKFNSLESVKTFIDNVDTNDKPVTTKRTTLGSTVKSFIAKLLW